MGRRLRKKAKIHQPYMKFKGWLRTIGKTYADVAEILGCTISTVSQKVNGNSDFYACEVVKILNEYGGDYNIFLP